MVVITIIGILIALLLPAIQAAREAARSLQCKNNLKQIGLALHNYEAAFHAFPFSFPKSAWSNPTNNPTFSWAVYLLPFVEQQGIYDQLDCGKNSAQAPNSNYAGELIPVYSCPSDPSSTLRITSGTMYADDFMHSVPATTPRSYMESEEVYDCSTGLSPNGYCLKGGGQGFYADTGYYAGGVVHVTSIRVRVIADITDGLSNTLAVAEGVPDCLNWSGWMYGDSPAFSTSNGINIYGSTCCRSLGGDWYNAWPHGETFRSMHPGSVNGMMADGSVHTIGETIDMTVFQRLGTIAGGEIASIP